MCFYGFGSIKYLLFLMANKGLQLYLPYFLQASQFIFNTRRMTCWDDVFKGKFLIYVWTVLKVGNINGAECTC